MNILKVTVLFAALTGLFVIIGKMVGGESGMVIAFCIALVMNVGSYWFSDKLALAAVRAHPVSEEQEPRLHAMVAQLAQNAGVPKPRVYLVDEPSPNAFATGRSPKHAAIAVNTGLLRILSEEEVYGVLAHEMAHIKSRDTLTMTVVATLAGAITMIASFARFGAIFGGFGGDSRDNNNIIGLLVMSIVAPIAALMIQMAVSRTREFSADKLGATLAHDADGLANALAKLHRGVHAVPDQSVSNQRASMYIVNPLFGGGFARLFSTHPPVEERIARLKELGL